MLIVLIKALLLLKPPFSSTAPPTLLLYPRAALRPLAVLLLELPLLPVRHRLFPLQLVIRGPPLPATRLQAPLLLVLDLLSPRPIVMVLWLVSWLLLVLSCSRRLVIICDLRECFLFSLMSWIRMFMVYRSYFNNSLNDPHTGVLFIIDRR